MKLLLIAFLILIAPSKPQCQVVQIPISDVEDYFRTDFSLVTDSSISRAISANIGVLNLHVRFMTALFDSATNRFCLAGQVCMNDKMTTCAGLPGVGVYYGATNAAKLSALNKITESGFADSTLANQGLFIFYVKPNENESIYFYHPQFFLVELYLGKLLKQVKSQTSKQQSKSKN